MQSHEQVCLIDCRDDQLVAIAHLPSEPKTLGIVLVVGGPQYRVGSHRQFTLMARTLSASGYPVLRFDYRGMGDSDGELKGFEQVDADIRASIDRFYELSPTLTGVVLWGLCDAASACMMYGNCKDRRVQRLILANPWVRTVAGEAKSYLRHYYVQRMMQKAFWSKLVRGSFNPAKSLQALFKTLRRASGGADLEEARDNGGNFIDRMLSGVNASPLAILFLISERDLTAKEFIDYCARNEAWGRLIRGDAVTLQYLNGMDHTFSTHGSVEGVSDICARWLAAPTANHSSKS